MEPLRKTLFVAQFQAAAKNTRPRRADAAGGPTLGAGDDRSDIDLLGKQEG
jgi:hypothetical protein